MPEPKAIEQHGSRIITALEHAWAAIQDAHKAAAPGVRGTRPIRAGPACTGATWTLAASRRHGRPYNRWAGIG